MRHNILVVAGCLAIVGCSEGGDAPTADNSTEVTNTATPAPTAAAMSINETSWTFTREGKNVEQSIDASGNYIANAGKEHVDHGTVAVVDGKACFTSAMDKEGPTCWTMQDVPIGGTGETVSDKGEKLTLTRVEYTPLSM